ncbi:GTP cyclohydrolase [Shewanella sp. JM162201]|uniref:GTP cyclohydrolase n=1 Tax=Shewanella jiangmenensis TaxID=2837387 RepID=A0ABS5UZ59_9GAMM|nr:YciI family protein [Shewanella jiangmenensis]MBT1442913.1 GTP cyclohydrolase [Shewanella jiangmenensis]
MFIVSLTYTAPLDEIDKFIPEHIAFLNEQYALGHFQLSGRKVPRTGGIIIATVKDRDSLDNILAKDPFQLEKLANYDVIEIVPTKSSKHLAFLIEP